MERGDGMAQPTIAVVDDDQEIRLFLETVLTDAGYTVRCWSSESAAFDDLVRDPPNLIILDLIFGDDPEAGWDALTLLRVEPPTAQIPVILVSVDQEFLRQRETILRTKKHATTLAKPFEVDALLAQIERSLTPGES
jgi:CheY-like chemotaxis protein